MDSDSPSWPEALPLPLVNPRIEFTNRGERTLFESGRVRNRRLEVSPVELIEVQWNFTEDEFDTFKTFFDATLVNGSVAFYIEIFGEVRGMIFWEATYTFTRSDNLFTVASKVSDAP